MPTAYFSGDERWVRHADKIQHGGAADRRAARKAQRQARKRSR